SATGSRWKIGETLPPATRPFLQQLGALSCFESGFHLSSYGNLSSWGSQELVATDFIFNPYGHGWQIDRALFEQQLTETAQSAGACLWYGAKLSDVHRRTGSQWEITVRQSERLRAVRTRYLIDATGRRSTVAHRLSARRRYVDT